MKLRKCFVWTPIALLLSVAGLPAASAETLRNEDINAGDCEKNCVQYVLLGADLFFVWKGEERPMLVVPFGPADGENARKEQNRGAVPVRGELNTGECVQACEALVRTANVELLVRRDGDGVIERIWVDVLDTGRVRRVRGAPGASPGGPQSSLGGGDGAGVCVGGGGTGPGDGECSRTTEVWVRHSCHCLAEEIIWIGEIQTLDCRGNIVDVRATEYRLPRHAVDGRCICLF